MAIGYFSQKRSFRFHHPKKTSAWLTTIAKREKTSIGDIQYVFCTDNFLLKLNQRFLGHDTFTDIITFDYSTGTSLAGEIYVSVERVKDNARLLHVAFDIELRRVMAHGLLHLVGYNDKAPAQKAQMRKKEEACLSLWP
jgi:rRNA maturation RNase YbeY